MLVLSHMQVAPLLKAMQPGEPAAIASSDLYSGAFYQRAVRVPRRGGVR